MSGIGLKKLYYSISEVSRITDLEQYILRYWETEFSQLKPSKNHAGNRIYTNKDIQLLLRIKRLLREQKYTIEGAKKILSGEAKDPEEERLSLAEKSKVLPEAAFSPAEHIQKKIQTNEIAQLKRDLLDIKEILLYLKNKI